MIPYDAKKLLFFGDPELWTPANETRTIFWWDWARTDKTTVTSGRVNQIQNIIKGDIATASSGPTLVYDNTVKTNVAQFNNSISERAIFNHALLNQYGSLDSGKVFDYGVFIIGVQDTGDQDPNGLFLSADYNGAPNSQIPDFRWRSGSADVRYSNDTYRVNTSVAANTWTLGSFYQTKTAGRTIRFNGTVIGAEGIGSDFNAWPSQGTNRGYLGGGLSAPLISGKIAAMVIFSPIDNTYITKLEGWAARKYKLRGLLPSNHPYKARGPKP